MTYECCLESVALIILPPSEAFRASACQRGCPSGSACSPGTGEDGAWFWVSTGNRNGDRRGSSGCLERSTCGSCIGGTPSAFGQLPVSIHIRNEGTSFALVKHISFCD